MTTEPTRTKRTARKEHKCAVPQGCDGTIRPGENYFDEVSPPWLEYCDDYDPEYGASYVRLGKWEHSRTHVSCSNAWMQKFNAEVHSGLITGRY